MNRADFINQLRTILTGKPLLWTSESDFPLSVVSLSLWTVYGLSRKQTMSKACSLIYEQRQSDRSEYRWIDLYHLFNAQPKRISFVRQSSEPGVFDLYLLVRFGWTFAGIKTKVVRT